VAVEWFERAIVENQLMGGGELARDGDIEGHGGSVCEAARDCLLV
jgi:hypothetical protein